MKVNLKAYAKINLILKVENTREDGFHNLQSLVSTVDLYDKVTLSMRKDKKINLKVSGLREYVYNCIPEEDNAYKAVKLYMEEYDTCGADIWVHKNIPLRSGMGGSSACASAVLVAMEKLCNKGADLRALANRLGSDTNYLLKGGWAKLSGRGDLVEYLPIKHKLQVVAIFNEGGVDTAKCFKEYEKKSMFNGNTPDNRAIDRFIQSLANDNPDYKYCVNDLQAVAQEINPEVKRSVEFLQSLSPECVFMTGSGATVCAMFSCEQLNLWAVEKCKKKGFDACILNTVIPK